MFLLSFSSLVSLVCLPPFLQPSFPVCLGFWQSQDVRIIHISLDLGSVGVFSNRTRQILAPVWEKDYAIDNETNDCNNTQISYKFLNHVLPFLDKAMAKFTVLVFSFSTHQKSKIGLFRVYPRCLCIFRCCCFALMFSVVRDWRLSKRIFPQVVDVLVISMNFVECDLVSTLK